MLVSVPDACLESTVQETPLTLFDVSTRLGVSPSAVKKRIANLNIPVERGARGKLLFEHEAFALLQRADELLKAGHGFEDCRRLLGLGEAPIPKDDDALVAEAVVPAAAEAPIEASGAETPEPETADVSSEEAPAVAMPAELARPTERPLPMPRVAEVPKVRPLATPVFIQLGRRKAAAESVAEESLPPTLPPDLLGRLDATLRLIEEKEKQNQMLQSKLLVAYDEMTKLSATAAAFQERSLNLQHEVNKLQGELRLLSSPSKARPWWKIWG
ncbi:MAG TPA: hypothetical protein V6D47_01245 [Oscillatoriaceae cyanobacterium]